MIKIYRTDGKFEILNLVVSGGGGSTQKSPATYRVGTTANAPTMGTSTWTLNDFENADVLLFLNGRSVPLIDMGTGNPYVTKVYADNFLTIGNYTWQTDDELTYELTVV